MMYETIKKNEITIKRGQIWWVNLGSHEGSIQSGKRPVLVIQNDKGNRYAPTILVAPISSQVHKAKLPTHVILNMGCGLTQESFVMLEQQTTINKTQLYQYIGMVSDSKIEEINKAYKIQGGVYNPFDIECFVDSFTEKYKMNNPKFETALQNHLTKYLKEIHSEFKVKYSENQIHSMALV